MDIPKYAQQAARQFQSTGCIAGGRKEDLSPEQVAEARDLWMESLLDCPAIDGSDADRDPAPNAIRLGEGQEEVLMEYSMSGPKQGKMESKLSPSESLYVRAEIGDHTIRAFRAAQEGDQTLLMGELLDFKSMTGQRVVLETDQGYLVNS
jgi:hypothetical protein